VREIVAFARPEMDRAGLELELDVQRDVPQALFDEGQIRQAILNVLRNAREAMADGGKIEVYVRAEGMSVVVGVDDRGSGIPEDVRSRIFDPFFSTKGEGTGLGLAITRQIVEAHGGSIVVEPREGGGTSFRLLLPIAPQRSSGAESVGYRRAEEEAS
jgi:signal transduction histidine kinase